MSNSMLVQLFSRYQPKGEPMINRTLRLTAAVLVAAICLWPVVTAAQDLAPLADSGLTIAQVRGAFASAGFQVGDPVTWEWTSPPVSSINVHDVANGRVVMVLVYPTTGAA